MLKPSRPLAEVGVLGLGAGTIAAYAEPASDSRSMRSILPWSGSRENMDYFTYLADCRGTTEVILGDARL